MYEQPVALAPRPSSLSFVLSLTRSLLQKKKKIIIKEREMSGRNKKKKKIDERNVPT